ncbi:hypothetical protein [Nocardia sp. CDC160]|uniref:hypothetical protein n=1 Tax=Nocardia sp. CDC160 TaxID=3112166 RepID=UPI002DB566C5|nr:hypothetical protein [Nocardia sp. CDC160]MEC3920207.1 hypothetical protein [Nocardia sp. CDC160]
MDPTGNLYIAAPDLAVLGAMGDPGAVIENLYGDFLHGQNISNNLGLQLTRDGRVAVITAPNVGTYLPTSLNAGFDLNDPSSYATDFPLYHPLGASEKLRFLLNVGETVGSAIIAPLKTNNPQAVPIPSGQTSGNPIEALVGSGLLSPTDHSVMLGALDANQANILNIVNQIHANHQYVATNTNQIPGKISNTLKAIDALRNVFNTLLRSAELSSVHPMDQIGGFGRNETANNLIPPPIEQGLMNGVGTLLVGAEKEVTDLLNQMSQAAKKTPSDPAIDPSSHKVGNPTPPPASAAPPANAGNQHTPGDSTPGAGSSNQVDDSGGDTTFHPVDLGINPDATNTTTTTGNAAAAAIQALADALAATPTTGSNNGEPSGGSPTESTTDSGVTTASSTGAPASSGFNPMMMMTLMTLPGIIQQALKGVGQTTSQKNTPDKSDRRSPIAQGLEQTPPANESADAPGQSDPAGPAAADNATSSLPSAVDKAIHTEFADSNGSNAVEAYKGTTGEEIPGSKPWTWIGGDQLRTGDVIQWEKGSALVVHDDTGLKVIYQGNPIPLDPNNPPSKDYGSFQGYRHPTGAFPDDATSISAPSSSTHPPAVN